MLHIKQSGLQYRELQDVCEAQQQFGMDIQVPEFLGAAKPEVSKTIVFVQVGL